ncbi:MAG: macro domain-containing protein [Oscillospiraceae bacterium]|nr:macro domain-containing protein [Oscillospiraceae bacterium]
MPFQIIRNDITKVTADAIVNTANPMPIVGGGTDFAIHEAAGPELLEARRKIGEIHIGQSVATPAFRLPAKYVLHTVSPVWIDGKQDEETRLRQAYDAALSLAHELGCKSVAFPLMAAGTYAFPLDIALSVATQAFTEFLFEHKMQIDLVLFNADAFDIAGSIFSDLKSFVDDNYVSDRTEEEYLIDEIPAGVYSEEQRREEVSRRRRRRERSDSVMNRPVCSSAAMQEAFKAAAAPPSSLEEMLRHQEQSFNEYFRDLLNERGGNYSEVYKRAEISRQLFSKILNKKNYTPTKDTVIQLAIGLQLDMAKTQKLLEKAGYALTRSSKADLVVQYYIEHKNYSVTFINEALDDCGLPLLKTGLA